MFGILLLASSFLWFVLDSFCPPLGIFTLPPLDRRQGIYNIFLRSEFVISATSAAVGVLAKAKHISQTFPGGLHNRVILRVRSRSMRVQDVRMDSFFKLRRYCDAGSLQRPFRIWFDIQLLDYLITLAGQFLQFLAIKNFERASLVFDHMLPLKIACCHAHAGSVRSQHRGKKIMSDDQGI
jgi:hypothetical protein